MFNHYFVHLCILLIMARYSFPQIQDNLLSDYTCSNLDCIASTVQDAQARNKLPFLVWFTHDFKGDNLSELFFGWIRYLFDIETVNLVLFECGGTCTDDVATFVAIMPQNTIFTIISNPTLALTLAPLISFREERGFQPPALLHLSDELPWMWNPSKGAQMYGSDEELAATYAKSPLVFRHYFYEPISHVSYQVPLGPILYGWMVGPDSRSPIDDAHVDQNFLSRSKFCFISARFVYDDVREHHEDRNEFLSHHINKTFECEVVTGDSPAQVGADGPPHGLIYQAYVRALRETIFAPCPSGNNLETFRQYEALEVGAIPIFRRPSSALHADRDFLTPWLLKGYPGPILNSWAQLGAFLTSMHANATALLVLRGEVAAWYTRYKREVKADIRTHLRRIGYLLEGEGTEEDNHQIKASVEVSPSLVG